MSDWIFILIIFVIVGIISTLKLVKMARNKQHPPEYYMGYAQAQADGTHLPLSDRDLEIGIQMQKNKIKELLETQEKLVKVVRNFLPFDMRCNVEKLYGGDRDHQLAIEQAKNTLKELGVNDE